MGERGQGICICRVLEAVHVKCNKCQLQAVFFMHSWAETEAGARSRDGLGE